MITCCISSKNLEEKKYILDIILCEFLGLKYNLKVGNFKDYELILENGRKLIVRDSFFSLLSNENYLKESNIPKNVRFIKNRFLVNENIPVLYGNNELEVSSRKIVCGIDIFASSFFMLTRWEEYVNKTRDEHNRFPSYASLASKFNFLDRPIVNEYVEMLWNMLRFLGCKQKRRERSFELILTHDVDHAFKYTSLVSGLREILGDVVKRKSLLLAFGNFLDKFLTHLRLKRDPFDTYDYLMDISERIGVKSYFFLHSSKHSKYDNDNDRYLKEIANRILNRGHYLGYHPSYDSYNNLEIFLKDKERIENIIGHKLTFGRQHYLRFEVPTTWRIWEKAGMRWDSTMGYADREGFRCGVCYSFSVFDFLNRKKLSLKERPLIIMEGTLRTYRRMNPEAAEDKIHLLKNTVKKYNGEFVMLWHNSSFDRNWDSYVPIYSGCLL